MIEPVGCKELFAAARTIQSATGVARFKAVLELLDYMRAKGGVWFARLDQVCDHVQRLIAEGRWTPRYETFPIYQSPLPEFSKDHRGAGTHGTTGSAHC